MMNSFNSLKKIACLIITTILKDLDFGKHIFYGLFDGGQFATENIAVLRNIPYKMSIYSLGFFIDPVFNIIQLDIKLLGFTVQLLGDPLKFL